MSEEKRYDAASDNEENQNGQSSEGEPEEIFESDQDAETQEPETDWEAVAESRYDQVVRLQADFENFRRRMDRERNEIQGHVAERLLGDLLPVFDNLERALAFMPTEGEAKAWRVGLEMTLKGFLDAFGKMGVQPIAAVGSLFDPRFHEAVQRVESSEPEGTVVEELQRGFVWNDRVLRASLVKVSSGE